jgi:hypothetical protein
MKGTPEVLCARELDSLCRQKLVLGISAAGKLFRGRFIYDPSGQKHSYIFVGQNGDPNYLCVMRGIGPRRNSKDALTISKTGDSYSFGTYVWRREIPVNSKEGRSFREYLNGLNDSVYSEADTVVMRRPLDLIEPRKESSSGIWEKINRVLNLEIPYISTSAYGMP